MFSASVCVRCRVLRPLGSRCDIDVSSGTLHIHKVFHFRPRLYRCFTIPDKHGLHRIYSDRWIQSNNQSPSWVVDPGEISLPILDHVYIFCFIARRKKNGATCFQLSRKMDCQRADSLLSLSHVFNTLFGWWFRQAILLSKHLPPGDYVACHPGSESCVYSLHQDSTMLFPTILPRDSYWNNQRSRPQR